ncbi:MAG: phenylalanine--tRNA ligase subunit alpha [Gammaproteobacteria bacterium AqS3]|nr:phenylalanine--tRNA ligase subunit alpha [Gammaproteobacteria bacterium AqS3]
MAPAQSGEADSIEALWADARTELDAVQTHEELEPLRLRWLGRRGRITLRLRGLGELDEAERPAAGAELNRLKGFISETLQMRHAELSAPVETPDIDVSLPGRAVETGGIHPCTAVMDEVEDFFAGLGYCTASGPEVEYESYNFDALNIPEDHPARTMHDTLYINAPVGRQGRQLLRTHTSPIQVRLLERQAPPVYAVSMGRTYRSDAPDATHIPMFHQIEGIVVDEGISFADLKGTIELFLRSFFGPDTEVRLRPSYFPFTEPSAEVDVRGSGGDWLEVMGCGLMHPKVLQGCGIDSARYSGFAFGMGVERLTMLRFGFADLRALISGDIDFLRQFR